MLYLTNLINCPYTGNLQYQSNESAKFSAKFEQNTIYKWNYKRALNESYCDKILKFEEKNMKLFLKGIIDMPIKLFLKFSFDVRVRFENGIDFSLGNSNVLITEAYNDINKEIDINSLVKKFNFIPYRDTVYINMNVKNNENKDNNEDINLTFERFGFDLTEIE